MRLFLLITLPALLAACALVPEPQRAPHSATEEVVVPELERRIAHLMEEGLVPGLAVGLIEGSEAVLVRGFGVKNAEAREPVTRSTVFEAASGDRNFKRHFGFSRKVQLAGQRCQRYRRGRRGSRDRWRVGGRVAGDSALGPESLPAAAWAGEPELDLRT